MGGMVWAACACTASHAVAQIRLTGPHNDAGGRDIPAKAWPARARTEWGERGAAADCSTRGGPRTRNAPSASRGALAGGVVRHEPHVCKRLHASRFCAHCRGAGGGAVERPWCASITRWAACGPTLPPPHAFRALPHTLAHLPPTQHQKLGVRRHGAAVLERCGWPVARPVARVIHLSHHGVTSLRHPIWWCAWVRCLPVGPSFVSSSAADPRAACACSLPCSCAWR